MLLPEWQPQWGVLLAWPDADTDWAGQLDAAHATYTALITAVLDHEAVLLLCRNGDSADQARRALKNAGADLTRLRIEQVDFDDTWARDFGPISVERDGVLTLLDFRFTGWGHKFAAQRDDAVNAALPWRAPRETVDLVLEGGAIDTDGRGTLLTTRACLRNPNRNPLLNEAELESRLRETLGVTRIWWLDHGELEGDDTDAHVDTLARFVDPTTVAYVGCDDPADPHHAELAAMAGELEALASAHDLRLVRLPMAVPQYNAEGERLPATYANFLITNDKILVPVYGCATDRAALDALAAVAGPRTVQGIPCRPLIEQGGSLHCVTMQLPQGIL
ncbi:agmatine deiminase family protein [Alcanivorax marinus]|uniref:Agmatine deiminase family protein n=1 Tax=Alloalcanivorax marinus TaxID=1177169 RepID=A0A9Q3UP70_9GAMM|nr:agmatine deiminase family protein [Alloalcanivorax marinus]MCC4309323.1 agmatine deiminase family protein [Alloalcanivorax marinus]MCU5788454.1 peptidyl-arginine deiminase family protein [Alloalcanivorax marinus]